MFHEKEYVESRNNKGGSNSRWIQESMEKEDVNRNREEYYESKRNIDSRKKGYSNSQKYNTNGGHEVSGFNKGSHEGHGGLGEVWGWHETKKFIESENDTDKTEEISKN